MPVVAQLESLEFHKQVTFFVGENGSGKSTVLEGIAAGLNAVAVGSADVQRDESLRGAHELASGFRVRASPPSAHDVVLSRGGRFRVHQTHASDHA